MSRIPRALDLPSEPEIHALLGPTNTGKTHRAIERMLRHSSGMIGLPLRLLAREVYDRVTARIGESAVALITGEERRVPPRPRYWVCTVESMPLGDDRRRAPEVDFVAVDEIQLAADPGRGHVFTDRILHARGRHETLFLGSDTIAPLLERLIPGIRIETRPRMSLLTHSGHHAIGRLPKRTVVVAFSAERVYALAERVRARHGGAAVVMGALSPRTRNAQVAMFQAGEVPTLVATDAIGMGLNMDVAHVAFAELHKFDGERTRFLHPGEAGQIAGRAGRHLADGTFGSTDAATRIAPDLAEAVSAQQFPVIKRLWWRNAAVDTRSVTELRRSLALPPPLPFLHRAATDEDERALRTLVEDPEVASRAADEARVRLLWEVCRVPDFRKSPGDVHVGLLSRLYRRLVDRGTLSPDWVGRQVDQVDRVDGDLDDLTARLAAIRTWTYIGHRAGWVDDAPTLQERARVVEDRLSDALHERLTERFVDRRSLALASGGAGRLSGDRIEVGGVEVARVEGLAVRGAGESLPARVRELVGAELEARVHRLVDDPSEVFSVDGQLRVCWRGAPVAVLGPGPDLREPSVRLLRNELLGAGARTRVERRLSAWSRDFVAAVLAPLRPLDAPRGAVRGLLYALEAGLGNAPVRSLADVREELRGPDRAALARFGVRLGVHHAYSLPMLDRARDRAVLVAARAGTGSVGEVPEGSAPPAVAGLTRETAPLLGYELVGPRLLRLDSYESVLAALRGRARTGAFLPPDELRALVGDDTPAVLAALGYREEDGRWMVRYGGPADKRGGGR